MQSTEGSHYEARLPFTESTTVKENANVTGSLLNVPSKRTKRRANVSLGVRTRRTYGGMSHSVGMENVRLRRSEPALKKSKVSLSTSISRTVASLRLPLAQTTQRNLSVGPTVLNDVANTIKDIPHANSVETLCAKHDPHKCQPIKTSVASTLVPSVSVASTSVAMASVAPATVATASVASASVVSRSASVSASNSTEPLRMIMPKHFDGDVEHEKDPQHVVEYLPDIYCRMHAKELKHIPEDFDYMRRQKEINPAMRASLNDWIVDVHKKFKLCTESLFLAVDLMDRFLGRRDVKRKQLHLIGLTALFVASKFEEIQPPAVREFVEVTGYACKKEEVLEMELLMLRELDFQVCRPTSIHFLTRFQYINGSSELHCCLTQFFLEMTLIEYAMIKYSPSHVAAAAVLLCNKLCQLNPCWTRDLEVHTCSAEGSLKNCVVDMFKILKEAPNNPLQAVRRKFGTNKYQNVSKHRFVGSSTHC